MKSFVKFLVTLIVVAVVGVIVYFLLINGKVDNNYEDNYENNLNNGSGESGDFNDRVPVDIFSGEKTESGDNFSGDFNDAEFNEPPVTIDPKEEISNKVALIESGENVTTYQENLEPEIVGESAKDFMNYFEQSTLSVTVNVKPGKIELIPAIDFLENQVFYYDENGNLILYEEISNTVEGINKYYFKDDVNIDIVSEYEEGVNNTLENSTDILNRAKALYTRFANR